MRVVVLLLLVGVQVASQRFRGCTSGLMLCNDTGYGVETAALNQARKMIWYCNESIISYVSPEHCSLHSSHIIWIAM